MRISIDVDLDDLAESFLMNCEQSKVIDFFMAVDKAHGDCQFTEDLILALVRSLRSDYGPAEFSELIEAITGAAIPEEGE